MTAINLTTGRTVYESPEGRVKVVRFGPKDFGLYLDGIYNTSYDYAFQAEAAGGAWLHDEMQRTATETADIAAEVAEARAAIVADGETIAYTEVRGGLFAVRFYDDGIMTVDVDGCGFQFEVGQLDHLAAILAHPTVVTARQRAAAGAPVVRVGA